MTRTAEAQAREAKIAELKHLITARRFDSFETLEAAVDTFMWGDYDRRVDEQEKQLRQLAHSHPK